LIASYAYSFINITGAASFMDQDGFYRTDIQAGRLSALLTHITSRLSF